MVHRWPTGTAVTLVILFFGGCLAVGGTGTPPATRTPSVATPIESTVTGCPSWVSFYGLGGPGETAWAPDRVAIGYTVPANVSVILVAFEDRRVLGTTHVGTAGLEYALTVDGDGIPLRNPLTGPHTIRVAAFADSDGNGRFDPGTDRLCRSEGEPVQAGPRRIDFSSLMYTGTPAGVATVS